MPSLRRHVGVTAGRAGNPAVVLLALGLALGGPVLGGCGSGDVTAKPDAPQGAEPVAWAGAFCGGLGDVLAAASAISKSQPTPEGQKDGLLGFSDNAQRAYTNTAEKLAQLGPPRITDGKRIQDTAVGFFTTAAGAARGQREKLAALDAKDPEFGAKANQLANPDLDAATTQMQQLTNSKELAPAFGAAAECQRLGGAPR